MHLGEKKLRKGSYFSLLVLYSLNYMLDAEIPPPPPQLKTPFAKKVKVKYYCSSSFQNTYHPTCV